MSLLYHPKTLDLLAKFKRTARPSILKTLLILILDNTAHIDILYLRNLLSSHADVSSDLVDTQLESLIKRLFVKSCLGNGNFRCICRNINKFKHAELILKNREGCPGVIGYGKNFIHELKEGKNKEPSCAQASGNINKDSNIETEFLLENTPLIIKYPVLQNLALENKTNILDQLDDPFTPKSAPDFDLTKRARRARDAPKQLSTLSFSKVKTETPVFTEKFAPLPLKNATYVYDPKCIRLTTLRMRDDLVNPIKLQFIKHFDQIRPPIYQKRGVIKKAVFSYKRIPEIISYDEDSSASWELIEEETASSEESFESEGEEEDWIEKDSEEAEMTRFNKKPSFIFQSVTIKEYFEPDRYKNANLFLCEDFSESLKGDFVRLYGEATDENIASFSQFFNVKPCAIKEAFLE